MEKFIGRTREWIHRPVFHGAPISWAKEYFQGRLKQFRKEHKQFDDFLVEINELMKAEQNVDFANLEKFIDGEAETNWISPRKTMFDAFIKLFNLCLSPKQAFNYIKGCLLLYKEMLENEYILCGKQKLLIKISSWDGMEGKFISFSVKPKNELKHWDNEYWFNITTDLQIIEEYSNDIIIHIDGFRLIASFEQLEDALMLFEYYQNRGLLRKVFNTGIEELKNKGVIKEVDQEDFYGWIIHKYETNLKISNKRKKRAF